MQFQTIIKLLASWSIFAIATARPELTPNNSENYLNQPSFFNSLTSEENDFSENEVHERNAPYISYGPPPPPPSLGITLNPTGLLEPHLEILRLIEAFIKLKGEVAGRIHAVVSDNWDLIQAVAKLLLKKIENLHSFSLTGISVLRKILEFAVNVFKSWTITLPTVSFNTPYGNPQPSYGLPPRAQGSGFSDWNNK